MLNFTCQPKIRNFLFASRRLLCISSVLRARGQGFPHVVTDLSHLQSVLCCCGKSKLTWILGVGFLNFGKFSSNSFWGVWILDFEYWILEFGFLIKKLSLNFGRCSFHYQCEEGGFGIFGCTQRIWNFLFMPIQVGGLIAKNTCLVMSGVKLRGFEASKSQTKSLLLSSRLGNGARKR